MELRRTRLAGFILSVVLLAVLFTALPASASPKRILQADGSGHVLDQSRLTTFGGHTLVDTFDGSSDSEWATALARTDYDVLVVGEVSGGYSGLDPSTVSSIANYVSAGRLIVHLGSHGNESDFLNAIYGFNTSVASETSTEALTGTLQPGATGTPFAGGPATLTDLSATVILDSTPGTTIYASPEGTWVFHAPFGSGFVNYLAWDFCCGTDSFQDDWYRVLDRALQFPEKKTPPGICKGQTATVTGTEQDDVLTGTEQRDVIAALGGNDQVRSLGGNDLVCGAAGKDVLRGGKNKDKLLGQAGKDKLRGQGGKDRLLGKRGRDRLNGGTAKDVCKGGKNDDTAKKCEVERSI